MASGPGSGPFPESSGSGPSQASRGSVSSSESSGSILFPDSPGSVPAFEAWLAVLYAAGYVAYLFWSQEGELLHWISLVLLPLLLVFLLRTRGGGDFKSTLAGFGLRRGNLSTGLGLALALGIGLGLLQLLVSRNASEVVETFRSGAAVYLLPLAFLLMVLTAGFTEEFFFRGFLQTRLEGLTGSKWWGLILASVIFGLYHLPYAYLNPNWPSAGDWGAALGASLGQGIPGGLILGGLFLRARRNLLACVVLHALINSVPAMAAIRFH